MRDTKRLIEENNEKRKLLSDDNLGLYEDFLLYIRTDLRVAEHESEELLMDLLDHMLEAQHEGRSGTELLGSDPKAYADELIEGLPKDKKRDVIPFISTQVSNSLGWFALVLSVVHLILPLFTEIKAPSPIGNLIVLALAVLGVSALGVKVIFTLIRSSLFSEKKAAKRAYLKAGIFGGGSFALILLFSWLMPDFGPTILIEWWIYLIIALILLATGKLIQRAYQTH
ncbi:DUF1129 domain-containing protein [Bacillus sp. RO2]|uniref:DUF1129 family protein n=1 Tax=Bacillus sp. RO2 TaxID=2723913 RepID=UPI00145CADD1|nr:DUF1129 family protein [Bacillus sp. RO2]NMH72392.1 DUF1129 domain-containing protein [Bacillus sp. RO2]